jgi:hypothetical protein
MFEGKIFYGFLLLALVLGLHSCVGLIKDIEGKVLDGETGQPVLNVKISDKGFYKTWDTYSPDSSGYFIHRVSKSKVRVTITAPGYKTMKKRLRVGYGPYTIPLQRTSPK